jgi:hypothetical protein
LETLLNIPIKTFQGFLQHQRQEHHYHYHLWLIKKTSPWTYMLTELDFPDASVLDCL